MVELNKSSISSKKKNRQIGRKNYWRSKKCIKEKFSKSDVNYVGYVADRILSLKNFYMYGHTNNFEINWQK